MPTDLDLIFNVIYMTGTTLLGGVNIWFVYRGYRRCMKHLEARESPAVVRQDIANLTFGAMLASAWGVLVGMSISSIGPEHKWIEATLLICVLIFTSILSVRPLRQLVRRLPDGPQIS